MIRYDHWTLEYNTPERRLSDVFEGLHTAIDSLCSSLSSRDAIEESDDLLVDLVALVGHRSKAHKRLQKALAEARKAGREITSEERKAKEDAKAEAS